MTYRFHLNSLICRPYNNCISAYVSKIPHRPMHYEIETDEGFTRKALIQALGGLEVSALDYVTHGEVPREGHAP
jgi:hypothetical protein